MKLKIFNIFEAHSDMDIKYGLKFTGQEVEKKHLEVIKELFYCYFYVDKDQHFLRLKNKKSIFEYYLYAITQVAKELCNPTIENLFYRKQDEEDIENFEKLASCAEKIIEGSSNSHSIYFTIALTQAANIILSRHRAIFYNIFEDPKQVKKPEYLEVEKKIIGALRKAVDALNQKIKSTDFQYVIEPSSNYDPEPILKLWQQLPKGITDKLNFFNLIFKNVYNIDFDLLIQERKSQENFLYKFMNKKLDNALLMQLLGKAIKNSKKKDILYFLNKNEYFGKNICAHDYDSQCVEKTRKLLTILKMTYESNKLNYQIFNSAVSKVNQEALSLISAKMYLEDELPFVIFNFDSNYFVHLFDTQLIKDITNEYSGFNNFIDQVNKKIVVEQPLVFTNLGKRRKLLDGMMSEYNLLNNKHLKKFSKLDSLLYNFKSACIQDPGRYKTHEMLKLLLVVWYNKKTSVLMYSSNEQEFLKAVVDNKKIFRVDRHEEMIAAASRRKEFSLVPLVRTIENLKIQQLEKLIYSSQDPEIQEWVEKLLKD